MKNKFLHLCTFAALVLSLGACKKDYGPTSLGPLQDSEAGIPVTVTNQNFFERVPIVVVTGVPASSLVSSTATNPFTITFQIPADKGTIKEITRVQTGATGLGLLSTGTAAQAYNYDATSGATKPVVGNGTNTITFTSSVAEYRSFRARFGTGAGNAGYVFPDITATNSTSAFNAQAPNQLRYFFLLTLGDGTQIIPMEVRVRLLQ
ncbi:hypothetical protein [Hymenobacter bucti]|uniref:DUF1735 domain-containing protein n=1 Tax=Hymenobacter bucti TaxID=1844114 RepID=A0ABW4QUV7_9BACT